MVLGRASGRVGGTTVASVRGMYFHYSVVLCNLL
jgi:hypothetical protein